MLKKLTSRQQGTISVIGARENNLKDIDIELPRNKLVVITGVSGSGKSSLAFDTIYAEGQRRYLETFSSYARQFMGNMERPDVEKITGLSPVISIEQKTTNRSPRSTVGTVTEVYDFFRLLYARAADAYSYVSGNKMVKFTEAQIIETIMTDYADAKISLLAPVVRGRKGHYRELFEQTRKQGYTKVRVDGVVIDLEPGLQINRYQTHDIEIVIDRIKVSKEREERLGKSIALALKMGNGAMLVLEQGSKDARPFSKRLMDAESGIAYEEPSPNAFSFNSPYGMCQDCKGLGSRHDVDMDLVIPDDTKSINQVGIAPFGDVRENITFKQLRAIAKEFKFTFSTPVKDIPKKALDVILNGTQGKSKIKIPAKDMSYEYRLSQEGVVNMIKRYFDDSSSENVRQWAEKFMTEVTCSTCNGARLKKESLHFKIDDKTISELAEKDLIDLAAWFEGLEDRLSEKQNAIAKDVLKEIRLRLKFLLDVGLGYLTLNRSARTLSGGESQRIRLATQIGSKLTGITYILDEPSIGLHQRDNQRLINSLKDLSQIGNTVIVVEHDKDIMLASDFLVDLGPGAGRLGGEIVAAGKPSDFQAIETTTSDYLAGRALIEIPEKPRKGTGKKIQLQGATGNNLQNVSVDFPLGKLICVTGVSGSGKSSLINSTLYPILRKHFYKSLQQPLPYKSIKGIDHIDKVIEIDQSPIGRTPRSNPATYTGVFTDIRKIFSELPESKIRGYKPGRFSFNVKGGRCETCGGAGKRIIEMNFLPDVQVECETCIGRRYNRETLEVMYRGRSISDVLNMTVDEATVFFKNMPRIHKKLKVLRDVGLGYITLGQSAVTLSGGEAQRVKLSQELTKRDTGNTLYILDEPTTGLHFADIQQLLKVLQKLVDKGNTMIIIEHNLDVVKVADHIIDIGPEGGKGGGEIVCEGTLKDIIKHPTSFTGEYLRKELSM